MNEEQLTSERRAFWAALAEAAPDLGIEASKAWEKEVPLSSDGAVRLKLSLSQDKTSVYLVANSQEAKHWVNENIEALTTLTRTVKGSASGEAAQGRWFRKDHMKAYYTVRRTWPEAIRWLRAQHLTFRKAVTEAEAQ